MKQKKYLLPESEIPTHYFNIQAIMPNKPLPFLHPATKQPLKPEDLYPIFCKACADQELNQTDEWIPIPEAVREQYAAYRCTPLVRAYELEKALGTPAHIYFKNESVSPAGSHKLNSAIAQAYYAKEQGITNLTTETGAGQWGGALSYATKKFGIDCAVYMVKVSYEQKPFRRSIMQAFGATVTPSPSMSTRAGKDIITRNNCKYALGSVLNHVCLHQTVIGLEAEKQMALAGEYPDIVIACFGGGSNFCGLSLPFMRHNIQDGKKTRFIAAEPCSCPKLTKGKFEYDFGDESGMTPLLPMFTLGHTFKPAAIHAGGLRYHGAGVILSQLMKQGRRALRPHRGYHPCPGKLPRHCRHRYRSPQVQRDRRTEDHPLQPLRPRLRGHERLRPVFLRRNAELPCLRYRPGQIHRQRRRPEQIILTHMVHF